MALVRNLINSGMGPRLSQLLGDTYQTLAAAGTTVSDATAVDDSIIYCTSASGANAGFVLPLIDKSKSKRHLFINESGVNIRVYVHDSGTEGMKISGTGTGTATYVNVANGRYVNIVNLAAGLWVGLT